MLRLSVNGIGMNVVDRGSGLPVLFVHGFPLDHCMWKAQLDALAPGYRVIAPDLRGFGHSGVTEGTVTMEQFADDLCEVLDELTVDQPVVLCGLSMGGYIAFEFLRKYGRRVCGLVLCDTKAAADTPEAAENRHKMAEQVLTEGPSALAASMTERLFSPSTREKHPEMVQKVQETILSTPPVGVAAALRGMAQRSDMTSLLGEIRLPTLVLVGEDDVITPPDEMRQMAQAIYRSEFVTIPHAGHLAPMEKPDAVSDVLRQFLRGLMVG
jgi:3-oxoadipate enol-lactonase